MDRGLLQGSERTELRDPFVQTADRFVDPVRGGESRGALDVNVRLRRRREPEGARELDACLRAPSELHQDAREREPSFGVVRLLCEKAAQGAPRRFMPVRVGQRPAAPQIRFREGRIELRRAVIVGESRNDLAVEPVQLASLEIQPRVVRALGDPIRRRDDLIVEVAVGGDESRKEQESDRDRRADRDPDPADSDA